jgi:hypothetical protein
VLFIFVSLLVADDWNLPAKQTPCVVRVFFVLGLIARGKVQFLFPRNQ